MSAGVEAKGVDETKRFLAALNGQIPYATSLALNRTGKVVVKAQQDEMRKVFDEPTPYTLKSLFQTGATKQKLETRTRIKSPKATEPGQTKERYIGVQIWGGRRKDKGSERRMRSFGLLPADMQMVPGAGLRLDRYGNVPGGRVAAILRAMGINPGSKTVAAGTFVVGEVGGTKGVWKVQRNKWVPIFIFVKRPDYDPRLDYYRVSEQTFEKSWNKIFGDAIDQALRTAK